MLATNVMHERPGHHPIRESARAPEPELPDGPAALVVGHPGHELRVHGWLQQRQVLVFALTDGSGQSGSSRLPATDALLARVSAALRTRCGGLPDATFYRALRDGAFDVFRRLAEELTQALYAASVSHVVGDAADGHNPAHDIARALLNAAVERLGRRLGRWIPNYEFPLLGDPRWPDRSEETQGARQPVVLQLSNAAFARKVAAARAYGELRAETDAALRSVNPDAFRVECLWPVPTRPAWFRTSLEPPAYESHGAQRVAHSRYAEVLRYREHVEPLIANLRAWAEEAAECAA